MISNLTSNSLLFLIIELKKHGFDETAFATALAIVYFNEKLNELKESWELVEGKAKKWLTKQFPDVKDSLLTVANTWIKDKLA